MQSRWTRFGTVSGALASVVCLGAGLWILTSVGFDHDDEVLSTGIGLYFIGKAFFVGPMLVLAARQLPRA